MPWRNNDSQQFRSGTVDERGFVINQFKQRFRVAGIEFDKAGIARFVWQTSGMARNTDDCFFGLT